MLIKYILRISFIGLLINNIRAVKNSYDQRKCEKIKVPFCQGLSYKMAIFPNTMLHETQNDAAVEINQFSPLVRIKCHPATQQFLCSLYFPICTITKKSLPPCRSFCEKIKNSCEPILKKFYFKWPLSMDCNNYPDKGDCIRDNLNGTLSDIKPYKAENFNVQIKNVIINDIKSQNYTITHLFCDASFKVNDTCIKTLTICFQQSCKTTDDGTFPEPFKITRKKIEISSKLNLTSEGAVSNLGDQATTTEISTKTDRLILENSFITTTVKIRVACQDDYLSPDCKYISLCPKLPSGMCQNNGTCSQTDSTISCKCTDKYKGNFCEEKVNPCESNLCNSNSTCLSNPTNDLGYQCLCKPNYSGRFCNEDVNECLNTSICSHILNATCYNTHGGYFCMCNTKCPVLTTSAPFVLSTQTSKPISEFSIKWPLPDLPTLLLVSLEGAVIIMLILVLIFVRNRKCSPKKKKSKILVDDNALFIKPKKSAKDVIEFQSNYGRPPIIVESNNRDSILPMFDVHEIDNAYNMPLDNPGMSTFGRR